MKRRKLTKAQIADNEAAKQVKYNQWKQFQKKYHGKTFTAVVRWFNKSSGEGVVRLDDGLSLPIYACNIAGRKTWYPETACVYYAEGQIVQIKVDVHMYSTIFAIGVTSGHLDIERWDQIKDKDLAFRCNEDGQAINGLFA